RNDARELAARMLPQVEFTGRHRCRIVVGGGDTRAAGFQQREREQAIAAAEIQRLLAGTSGLAEKGRQMLQQETAALIEAVPRENTRLAVYRLAVPVADDLQCMVIRRIQRSGCGSSFGKAVQMQVAVAAF